MKKEYLPWNSKPEENHESIDLFSKPSLYPKRKEEIKQQVFGVQTRVTLPWIINITEAEEEQKW